MTGPIVLLLSHPILKSYLVAPPTTDDILLVQWDLESVAKSMFHSSSS